MVGTLRGSLWGLRNVAIVRENFVNKKCHKRLGTIILKLESSNLFFEHMFLMKLRYKCGNFSGFAQGNSFSCRWDILFFDFWSFWTPPRNQPKIMLVRFFVSHERVFKSLKMMMKEVSISFPKFGEICCFATKTTRKILTTIQFHRHYFERIKKLCVPYFEYFPDHKLIYHQRCKIWRIWLNWNIFPYISK